VGGLARRATILDSLHQKEDPVLLLDAGRVFPHLQIPISRLKAKLSLKIMERMGYDALNLSSNELAFGKIFWEDVSADFSFPLVTSNLIDKISGRAWGKRYLIKEKGGITVAILGIMPVNYLRHQISYPNFTIIPPEEALKALVPEVKEKADLVVLLSSCGVNETARLIEGIEGIDLVIASGKKGLKGNPLDDPTPIVQPGGKRVGIFKITLSDDGSIAKKANRFIFLGQEIALDEEVEKIIREDLSEEALAKWKAEQKAKYEAQQKQIQELQKLSPEEYINLIRQRNRIQEEKNNEDL